MTKLDAAEPKSLEILESVSAVFAAKGFDGASMQDLARAAGMSAGNFYRYFPSKGAIVEAMIEHHIAQVRAEFAKIMTSPNPMQAIAELIRWRIETVDACEEQIMAEIEANASRRTEVSLLLMRMEQEIVRNIVAVFAKVTGHSESAAQERFAAHARLIFLLVRGVSVRAASMGGASAEPDRELAALVLKTIRQILDEIAASVGEAPEPVNEVC